MDSLPVFMMLQDRPVILLGDGDAVEAKARLLARAGAIVARDEAADARIAIVAIGDPAEAEAAVWRLRARGLLVNAVDRPALCDFILPAIVDRSPVLVAIGTGGTSASLAKALRQWLERALPASLGHLASSLRQARAEVARRHPDAEDRRLFLDDLLSPGGALDPLADHADPADALRRSLAGKGPARARGTEEVLLLSGDPDDLTLRAARLLAGADRVYYQPGIPAAIVDRARADAQRIECAAPPDAAPPGRNVFLKVVAR